MILNLLSPCSHVMPGLSRLTFCLQNEVNTKLLAKITQNIIINCSSVAVVPSLWSQGFKKVDRQVLVVDIKDGAILSVSW